MDTLLKKYLKNEEEQIGKTLDSYKGIEFLKEFYDVERTLSFEDVLDDLAAICRKNGGVG